MSRNQSPQGIRDGAPSVSKFEIGLFVREAEQKPPRVFCRCVTPPHHRGELRPLRFFKSDTHPRIADIPPYPWPNCSVDRCSRCPEANRSENVLLSAFHPRDYEEPRAKIARPVSPKVAGPPANVSVGHAAALVEWGNSPLLEKPYCHVALETLIT